MTDVWAGMYDAIYASAIAVDAEFESAGGVSATLRVTDETSGIAISAGPPGQVESVRPTCRVRASELATNGIELADLPDSTITLNGQTWTVKASRRVPSPMGETAGEIMLILFSEG